MKENVIALALLLVIASGASRAPLSHLTNPSQSDQWPKSAMGLLPKDENLNPLLFSAVSLESCSITVQWEYSGDEESIILTYSQQGGHSTSIKNPTPNPFTIASLYPSTMYDVCITISGFHPGCIPVNTTSLGPSPPPSLDFITTSKYIVVLWQTPDTKCKMYGYRIQWAEDSPWDDDTSTHTEEISEGNTNYKVNSLVPYMNYNICVSGWTEKPYYIKIYGDKTCETIQTKEDKPGPPRYVTARAISSSQLGVSWEKPNQINGQLLGYVVKRGKEQFNATDSPVTLGGLDPCTNYKVSVRARTGAGLGEEAITSAKTLTGPPPAPERLTVHPQSPREVSLSWSSPNTLCTIASYRIKYTGDVLWSEEVSQGSQKVEGHITSSRLTSLVPFTNYTVSVSASVEGDFGKEKNLIFTTYEDVPSAPSGLCKLLHDTETSIVVAWTPPDELNGLLLNYIVTWTLNDEDISTAAAGFTTEREFTLNDLKKSSDYRVSVQASTSAGIGPTIEKNFGNNPEGTPPSDLSVTALSSSEMQVTWDYDDPSVSSPEFNISWFPVDEETQFFDYDLVYEEHYVISGVHSDKIYKVCIVVLSDEHGQSCPQCTFGTTENWTPPPPDLALILGLTLGLGLPLLALVVCVVLYRYRKLPNVQYFTRQYLAQRKRSSYDHTSMTKVLLNIEFGKLPMGDKDAPCLAATLDENLDKNRYTDIYPYDRNRVELQRGKHSRSTGYINASFVFNQRFIVTQDPLLHTQEDLWQTIWEHRVRMIIILSSSLQTGSGQDPFPKYWPDQGDEWHIEYSRLRILNQDEGLIDHVILRKLLLTNPTNSQTLRVDHLQLTSFAGNNAFKDVSILLKIVNKARSLARWPQSQEGPVLLHCGAGSGRTGVFIGLWKLLEDNDSGMIPANLYRVVEEMRRSRPGMVQTERQYRFMYDCLTEYRKNPGKYRVYDDERSNYEEL